MVKGAAITVTRSSSEIPLSLAAILSFPAVVFIGELCGVHLLALNSLPIFLLSLTLCACLDVAAWKGAVNPRSKEFWGVFGILSAGLLLFLWVMSPTDVIPAHDAIAVPAFARILFDLGSIPQFVGAEHRVPFLYPPGFPILLTDLFKIVSPAKVLIIFKYVCVLAVGVTPFTWAWATRRLFLDKETPLWLLGVVMVLGFILFDRTLVFALAVAGKNSQLFQSAMMPFLLVYFVNVRRLGSCIVMALCGCGMFLIHYSGLYMLAILLGAWSVVRIVAERDVRGCVRPWCVFVMAVALFAPRALQVTKNSGAVSRATGSFVGFSWDILAVITEELNNFIFIFNEIGIPWSYKGWCALGVLVVAAIIVVMKWTQDKCLSAETIGAAGKGTALAFFALSWTVAALIGYGMLPVPGINLDYTRWFSYNFLAAAIGVAVFILAPYLRHSWIAATLALPVVGYGVWNSFYDVKAAHSWIAKYTFPISDIRRLMRVLPQEYPCQLVTRNGGPGTFMYQLPRVAEYVPVVSRCDIVSGSYIAPDSFGLDALGIPTPEFLIHRRGQGPMFFLGKYGDAKRLKELYAPSSITLERVKLIDKLGLWKVNLDAAVVPPVVPQISRSE